MRISHSPEDLTPVQSEFSQEPTEDISDKPVDWSADEPAEEPAGEPEDQTRKMTMITQDIVCRFLAEFNKQSRAPLKKIAEAVGISFHTAKNLSLKIRRGEYDCGGKILYCPKKKGRMPLRTPANERRVCEVLIWLTTMSLRKAKDVLAEENINMSIAALSRIAEDKKLSYQKTTSRAGVVFTNESFQKRRDYAVGVNAIPGGAALVPRRE